MRNKEFEQYNRQLRKTTPKERINQNTGELIDPTQAEINDYKSNFTSIYPENKQINAVPMSTLANPPTPIEIPTPTVPTPPSTFVQNLDPAIKAGNDGIIRAQTEEAQKQRLQEILERSKELQDSLGEEPDKDEEGVVTVAVRFSDGGRGQRRFNGEDHVDQVFNWIDVAFEIERETFGLVTMNGKKSFTFGQQDGVSLKDTGMGKMFALRVIKKEHKESGEEDSSIGEKND
jgi:hypothetical protein